MLIEQQLEKTLLAYYHQYQANDLQRDIREGLVKEIVVSDWQDGWNKTMFAPSLISEEVETAILRAQHSAYQKAITYHLGRAEILLAELGAPNSITLTLPEFEEFCSRFPFGTEPEIADLLSFLLIQNKGQQP